MLHNLNLSFILIEVICILKKIESINLNEIYISYTIPFFGNITFSANLDINFENKFGYSV